MRKQPKKEEPLLYSASQRKEANEEMRNQRIGQALTGRKCPREEAVIKQLREKYTG